MDFNPAQLDAWLTTDSAAENEEELLAEFEKSPAHADAYGNYCDDFPYSVDYERAYERWLNEQIDP